MGSVREELGMSHMWWPDDVKKDATYTKTPKHTRCADPTGEQPRETPRLKHVGCLVRKRVLVAAW